MDESPLTEVLMWSEPGGAGGHYTARWEPGGELGPQWRQVGNTRRGGGGRRIRNWVRNGPANSESLNIPELRFFSTAGALVVKTF